MVKLSFACETFALSAETDSCSKPKKYVYIYFMQLQEVYNFDKIRHFSTKKDTPKDGDAL